jgi:predicted nucleic-acid-binding protein
MKSFDTNVVVRLIVKDDPEQCERAEQAWRRAIAEDGAFLSATVLVEVVWVLRAACNWTEQPPPERFEGSSTPKL